MKAEIVTIGTELLLGQIVDTNAAWIAGQLHQIGVDVVYTSTVGDHADRMREILNRALERTDIVLTTGGIGPTEDDLTRQIAAEITGRKLIFHEDLLKQIQQIFSKRGLTFHENNRRQAYLPDGAIPIENPQGTAPGYIIEDTRGILLSLPGVPREMKFLMQETVLPYLRKQTGSSTIRYRVLKVCGVGESHIDHLISDIMQNTTNPEIGLLAHVGQVDIRIAAKSHTEEDADRLIEEQERRIRERLPYHIFGRDHETQEDIIIGLLKQRSQTLAIAESSSGGYIAQQFSAVPGVEHVLRGAVLTMNAESLRRLLPQSRERLEGAEFVSMAAAKAMAMAVARSCGAYIGLGISGVPQSKYGRITDDPVPTYIAVYKKDGSFVVQDYHLSGSPDIVRTRVKNMALELLRRDILGIHQHFSS
ncbi:competence/damage-inducible protein A [candidate division KSB3 bacterium]|uniref:CinA-like protein n=1 Tax=candidate division KSB3 bacterium TaxID=2044937 RepID=A0A2G6E3W9_9BACT|nr:MAG: competence/damage-inducible protein A [candidate division KSB3 bacterium]PIE29189.1 MAG: competence/damage-inducible protein A [candidate division KSB3 bacterium]